MESLFKCWDPARTRRSQIAAEMATRTREFITTPGLSRQGYQMKSLMKEYHPLTEMQWS